ncbi:MAG: hypothetical protein BRD55_11905 [Bacteroidetes bacterium SW_9_63_38]|nr:MAG: hypothetical protein BRD55_11905 [Bacteroidetes bacterium SW_9_63_38]
MSDATVDRFYYIFDSRAHRALVLDRATGKEVAWRSVPRVQLIEHIEAERSPAVLRAFARWCARQVGIEAMSENAPAARLWSAAQQDDPAAWKAAREETTDAVVRAAALGLSRGRSAAARLLVVHACTHPEARQAAIDATHMTERWVEFDEGRPAEPAVRAVRQRHIDWLLDALNRGREE